MDGYCCCFQGILAACFCFRECVKEASENVGGFLIHDLGSLQFAALSLQKSFSVLR